MAVSPGPLQQPWPSRDLSGQLDRCEQHLRNTNEEKTGERKGNYHKHPTSVLSLTWLQSCVRASTHSMRVQGPGVTPTVGCCPRTQRAAAWRAQPLPSPEPEETLPVPQLSPAASPGNPAHLGCNCTHSFSEAFPTRPLRWAHHSQDDCSKGQVPGPSVQDTGVTSHSPPTTSVLHAHTCEGTHAHTPHTILSSRCNHGGKGQE